MRRPLIAFLTALLSLSFGMLPVLAAQDATPASGLAEAGLPQLEVTVTATGYEGIPDEVETGRYLVSLTVGEDVGEFGGGVAFVQPPSGVTANDFLSEVLGPPDESGVGAVAGTPVEEVEASPADGAGAIPEVIYEATYAGGIYAETGQTAQVVLDLAPGEWIAWADDPEAPQIPAIFEATGEMPADLPEPASNATISMGEYIIAVTEGELTAGQQVIRIDNIGSQPHFIGWFLGPEGMTEEQIQVVLDEEMEAEMTGTPPVYSDLNPEEDLMPVTFTATQSGGTSMWVTVNLEAGSHGLACFFPDIADAVPHAYKGMYVVIDVEE